MTVIFLVIPLKKNSHSILNYKCKNYFSSAYFSSKAINRGIDIVTRMIKVVIKDLERAKEPSIKGDKNLNESILVIKETTKKLKRDTFLFLIDVSIKSLRQLMTTNIVNIIREIK
jgi:hypothetical protein